MTREYCNEVQEDTENFDDKKFYSSIFSILRVFYDDKETFMSAARYVPVLPYCSERFRDDKEVVLAAIPRSEYSDLHLISDRLMDDEEVALAIIRRYPTALRLISDRLRYDDTIICKAISYSGNGSRGNLDLNVLPEKTWSNKDMVLYIIRNADKYHFIEWWGISSPYCYCSEELKDDKEVVLAALTCCGTVLKIVPTKYKNDPVFVAAAIENDAEAIFYALKKLRENRDLLRLALSMAERQADSERTFNRPRKEIIARIEGLLEELNEN